MGDVIGHSAFTLLKIEKEKQILLADLLGEHDEHLNDLESQVKRHKMLLDYVLTIVSTEELYAILEFKNELKL